MLQTHTQHEPLYVEHYNVDTHVATNIYKRQHDITQFTTAPAQHERHNLDNRAPNLHQT